MRRPQGVFRWGVAWRGAAACVLLAASALAQGRLAVHSLPEWEAGCQAEPGGGCALVVRSAVVLQLHGGEHLRRPVRLLFQPGGTLQVATGVLDLAGSSVEAGLGRQIFTGRVVGLRIASPDWFASPEQGVYPAEALRRAYAATVPWSTLYLGRALYVSPFMDPAYRSVCAAAAHGVDSPRNLVGEGRPVPDDGLAPTRLSGGTVLLGEVCGSGAMRLAHLGVDEGAFAVAHYLQRRPAFGILAESQDNFGKVTGTLLQDVSVLTWGGEGTHSVLIEGQRAARVQDLWIWTRGGTHGLVMKSFDSTVTGLHCRGAKSDCLLLKSDYATDGAGSASGDVVRDVDIASLSAPGDTGGVLLDGAWDALRDVQITGVRETGVRYGFVAVSSIFHRVADVQLRNWTVGGVQGPCLKLQGASDVRTEAYRCTQAPGAWGPATLRSQPAVFVKGNLRILYTQANFRLHAWGAGQILAGCGALVLAGALLRRKRTPAAEATSGAVNGPAR